MTDPKKVIICIPSGDEVKTDFMFSLISMLDQCTHAGISFDIRNRRVSNIANSREWLAEGALTVSGAQHILWIDSDMTFPPWALKRLLDLKQPIVSATYSTRQRPFRPVAHTSQEGDLGDLNQDELIEAESTGLGFMLMERKVLEEMEQPRFPIEWDTVAEHHLGEDNGFCSKAREMGYKIMIDPVLSRHIGHIGSYVYRLTEKSPWPCTTG